jgi:ABC-type polysaccharide/polyol phosphate export permease
MIFHAAAAQHPHPLLLGYRGQLLGQPGFAHAGLPPICGTSGWPSAMTGETIARRSLLKFLRTPQLVGTATIQGVLFLVIFRYIFGGAIPAGPLGFVGFVVPGILTTMLTWQGMGAALNLTEDRAQGLALLLVPFTFVSSAYVPVSSMPSGLRAVATHQPVTAMIEAVRGLTGGAPAEALLGHPASYFVVRSLAWSAVLLVVFGSIAVARYRRGCG